MKKDGIETKRYVSVIDMGYCWFIILYLYIYLYILCILGLHKENCYKY